MDVHHDVLDAVAIRPFWILALELAHVTDPPDMVADAVVVLVAVLHRAADQRFGHSDRLLYRAIRVTAAANVEHFAEDWAAEEGPECFDQIARMDVISDLLSLVSENSIRRRGHGALHQVREETVKLCARMTRSR